MNPDQPSREQIEARLTALLLGELPAAEAELLRWTISRDPELQKQHDQLKVTMGFVREAMKNPTGAPLNKETPLKMAQERRQTLLTHFKTARPQSAHKPESFWLKRIDILPRKVSPLIPALVVIAIIALLAAALLPVLGRREKGSVTASSLGKPTAELHLGLATTISGRQTTKLEVAAPPPPVAGEDQSANRRRDESKATPPALIALPNTESLQAESGEFSGPTVYQHNVVGYVNINPSSANVQQIPNKLALKNGAVSGAATSWSSTLPSEQPVLVPNTGLPEPPKPESEFTFSPSPPAPPQSQATASPIMPPAKMLPPPPASAPQPQADPTSTFASVTPSAPNAPIPERALNEWSDAKGEKNAVSGNNDNGIVNGINPGASQITSSQPTPAGGTYAAWSANDANLNLRAPTKSLPGGVGFADRLDYATNGSPQAPQYFNFPDAPSAGYVTNAIAMNLDQRLYRPVNKSDLGGEGNYKMDLSKLGWTPIPPASVTVPPVGAGGNISDTPVLRPPPPQQKDTQNSESLADLQTMFPVVLGPRVLREAAEPLPPPRASAPVPQPEIQTSDNAFSTFSLNVSDVSFKLAMASLQKGQMPDPASIRSEEFINAFDYHDPEPLQGQPLAFAYERARDPFAQERDLLRFSVKAAASGRQDGRALNLVLLLDTSGSMERADRVAIIRQALRVLAAQLQPQDTVSVVSFARTARLWADGLPGDQAGATLDKVSSITPEGGTNLEEAMRLAYETALRHFITGGMNRVVLLTDGAANLGNVDPAVLTHKVDAERRQGIALDCFGIGWDNYNDDLLEQLSSNGDGRYAFINSPDEAATEFAAKLAGALQVAAEDVKVQVEFNPNRVTAWRQIGYAKHQLTKQQFRDNSVAAGAIAAREAGNALYAIETKPDGEGPIATVRVRYRVPGTQDNRERSWLVEYTGAAPELAQSSPAMRLAASAGEISEWMADSPFAQDVTPDALLNYLSGVPQFYGTDERPKQLEWLIREAKSVSGK
jgi:secreted protein with Ig-like and vWFA domain